MISNKIKHKYVEPHPEIHLPEGFTLQTGKADAAAANTGPGQESNAGGAFFTRKMES